MAIPKTLSNYLAGKEARYEAITHRVVYTAYDAAQTLNRELHQVAKSLLVAADKAYVIVVLPASMRLDLGKLKKALKAKKVSLPPEKVMVKIFKVKPGAMTPFGGHHKAAVIVDKSLLKAKDVVLSAGTFTDSVIMKAKDFIKTEGATLAAFAAKADYLSPTAARKKSQQANVLMRKLKAKKQALKAKVAVKAKKIKRSVKAKAKKVAKRTKR